MQLAPPRNHWWHVTLYVDTRGLTTRRLHHRDTRFDIRLDFVDHALVVSNDPDSSRYEDRDHDDVNDAYDEEPGDPYNDSDGDGYDNFGDDDPSNYDYDSAP